MKIVPMGATPQAPNTPTVPTSSAAAARERAISILTGGSPAQAPQSAAPAQAQEHPVQNASQVSVEEFAALQIPKPNLIADEPSSEISPNNEDLASEPVAQAEAAKQTDEAASVSKRLAMLAQREKAARAKVIQQEQALKAREEALKAREAELQAKSQIDLSAYVPKAKFAEDPYSVVAELGIPYQEVAQKLLEAQPLDPRVQAHIQKLEAQLQKMNESMEQSRKAQEQAQTEAYQNAIKQLEMDAKRLIEKDPAYETIKVTRSTKEVVRLIEDTYKEEGRIMSVQEAAQAVEDYLVDQIANVAKLNKIQSRLKPASAPVSKAAQTVAQNMAPESKQPQAAAPAMKTLTNTNSVPSRQLSARERAILAFKGELK